jgi:methyl-accepting chemotaxis protein
MSAKASQLPTSLGASLTDNAGSDARARSAPIPLTTVEVGKQQRDHRLIRRLAVAAIVSAVTTVMLAYAVWQVMAHAQRTQIASADLHIDAQAIGVSAMRLGTGDVSVLDDLRTTHARIKRWIELGGSTRSDGGPVHADRPGLRNAGPGNLVDSWRRVDARVVELLGALGNSALSGPPTSGAPAGAERVAQAARELASESESFAKHVADLRSAQAHAPSGQVLQAAMFGALTLAIVCVLLIVKRVTALAAQQQAGQQDARAHRRTQQAILRLLDEIGNLAQGDLTARANINEDVTGAVADAINYAVGELRRLVAEIDLAASALGAASGDAERVSTALLSAAERQSEEIAETNVAVERIAMSIERISARAEDSAQVASLSLTAAAEGTGAVQHAITGMDVIREQMQDTAKHIKHLGESAQEIGEIVDLIADFTERTNILALNAAIQATGTGSAGRGFALVAEEMQRLAERSARATQQISAIVKTIQTDTQDVTSAMERSTQGVVEQTALANAAGFTLHRIDEVTRQLASLIEEISQATRDQYAQAERVRANMADILKGNEHTSHGTRESAASTARLADLARKLKLSIANFKLS